MTLTHIKLGILGVGILFTIIGGCYLYAQWNVVQTPIDVDLAALEQGGLKIPGRYIRIEQYVSRVDHAFVTQLEDNAGRVIANVDYFYPIVSRENPAAAGEEAPLERFTVAVRRTGVSKNGDGSWRIPPGPLVGTVAIGFDALEGGEADYLKRAYPNLDAQTVIVLIPDQKPWITMGSWIWLVFGLVVTLVGAASLLQRGDE